MRILQVCNVGRIAGGTAACAWTITRTLPDCEHHIAFFSPPTSETQMAFRHATLHQWPRVDEPRLRTIRPDLVILHNTSPSRCEPIDSAVTLQYVHSRGQRAAADRTVYCSRWLRDECIRSKNSDTAPGSVLYQSVSRPPREPGCVHRSLNESMIVGRLCTPTAAKWPESLVGFYTDRARRHPDIEWEFVGCPDSMTHMLGEACRGRARFYPASWSARSHLWRWDALLYHHTTLTESFGRTAAEAMRVGCVPIVDDRGGFREQVAAGTGGLCRSAGDFDAALSSMQDRHVRNAMSQRAIEHADRLFSIDAFRERLRAAFADLATG